MPKETTVTRDGNEFGAYVCRDGLEFLFDPDSEEAKARAEQRAKRHEKAADETTEVEEDEEDTGVSGEAGSAYPYDDVHHGTLRSDIKDGEHDDELEMIRKNDHRPSVVKAAEERMEALE